MLLFYLVDYVYNLYLTSYLIIHSVSDILLIRFWIQSLIDQWLNQSLYVWYFNEFFLGSFDDLPVIKARQNSNTELCCAIFQYENEINISWDNWLTTF